jgi:hypothetical protein
MLMKRKKATANEVTFIFNVTVTETVKGLDKDTDYDILKKNLEEIIKKRLKVDDVKVNKVQTFLMEKEE